jgi:alcohol dehydrogenase
MKAALMTTFGGPLPVETVPDPACPRDGAIVAVRACGVCRSDHHAWTGADPDVALPHVMGHEVAGEVVETGAECRAFSVGERVTAPFILGCGACPDCHAGAPTVCASQQVIGFTRWGAFAEFVAVPRADFNLVRLPAELPDSTAAGMGCRVTTAFRAVVDRAAVRPGEWLAVHGCGGVGLSAVMIGAAIGARVLAIDIAPQALQMAREMGASATLDARGADVGAAVRELTGGGADVAVEALGITDTFEASLRSLRPLGRHVQVGMPVGAHAAPPLPLLELVYARQISLIGTRGIGASRFDALFAMIAAGRLSPGHMVTRGIPLSGVEAALRDMDSFQGHGVTVIDRLDC